MTDIIISLFEGELTFSFNSELTEQSEFLFSRKISRGTYQVFLLQDSTFLEYSLGHLPSDIDGDRAFLVCDFFGEMSGLFNKKPDPKVAKAFPEYLRPQEGEFVIYAGSFRPWHVGHKECVEQAIANGFKVMICPDRNPWKENQAKSENPLSQMVSIIDRVKELKNVSVYCGFLALNESNPTINWLSTVNTEKKMLLMGDDSFLSIHKWKSALELLDELDEIVVVPRLASNEQRQRQINKLIEMNKQIKVRVLKKHPYENISSTDIRNLKPE